MAKRRRFKTITPEGVTRKLNRLIAEELKSSYPQLYEVLEERARQKVIQDTNDPLTEILTFGIDKVHQPSQMLIIYKRISKKEREEYLRKYGV